MARIFHPRPRAVNPMLVLILGLLIFLGVHSVRIFADGWRASTIARIGEKPWKGLYTLVSLVGFGLIVWGYSLARQQPVVLWQPPVMMKHLNSLFTLAAFILLAAAYVPRNQIKARLHHPMVLAVKLWAFGHLLATAKLADVVLFGAFLLWAILDFRAARQRDRDAPPCAVETGVGHALGGHAMDEHHQWKLARAALQHRPRRQEARGGIIDAHRHRRAIGDSQMFLTPCHRPPHVWIPVHTAVARRVLRAGGWRVERVRASTHCGKRV